MENHRDRELDIERREWLESIDYVLRERKPAEVKSLVRPILAHIRSEGVEIPNCSTTPYINTIPREQQPPYPGRREIERRIKSIVRWNAMAMVVRANREEAGIGAHISAFASVFGRSCRGS